MKDYLFRKSIPIITKYSESSDDLVYKYLSRGLGTLFGNDQRNLIYFALVISIPGLLCGFIGLLMTSLGHPILMIFNCLLLLFIAWVFWSVWNIYRKFNECERKRLESEKEQLE